MITYLTHPEHGVHIAYTDAEIEMCKSNGWQVAEEAKAEVIEPPKKRGRPKKAEA